MNTVTSPNTPAANHSGTAANANQINVKEGPETDPIRSLLP